MHAPTGDKSGGRQVVVALAAAALLVIALWRVAATTAPKHAPPLPDTPTLKAAATTAPATAPATDADAFVAPTLDDDPAADGWDTEVFSSAAEKQLKLIAKWIAHPEKLTLANIAKIADDEVTCSILRPNEAQRVFDERPIEVRRLLDIPPAPPAFHGHDGLLRALRQLHEPFKGAADLWAKPKLFNIEFRGDTAMTRQYFAISGDTPDGPLEENVTWVTIWDRQSPPKLKSLHLESYEQTRLDASRPLFADCTEGVLQHKMAEDDLLGHSLAHWNMRIQAMYGHTAMGYHGLALGDVNGDGLDDVYICQPGGLPNQLFVHNADGTVNDRSEAAGLDWMDVTFSALFVDLDNDGDQDLVQGGFPQMAVFENGGKGRFRGRKLLPGSALPRTLAAADVDNDGDLDLYVCYYTNGTPMPYHDANNGPRNIFWRNDGNFRFVDMTRQSGLDVNNTRYSYGAVFDDYDNDGDQDLYIANDFGRNNLYKNNGDGTFKDVAPATGSEDISPGMSAAFGDYNNDGYMDIYVANMFSSAGNRIMFQNRFKSDVDDWTRSAYQRHARGNTLLKALADGTYEDVSVEAGVTMGRWAWCSLFLDLNNDMWQDLVIANGHITNEDTKDL